jgi:biopolymer transport protein TolR
MGMSLGTAKRGQVVPQMNVTPLVDVVLVLLIIFMVVTPLLSKQLWLQLPKQEESATPSENKSVVLTVDKDGAFKINGEIIARAELRDRVARAMAARPDKVVYFDAADDAPYAATVEGMDIARQGGAKSVAILTKKVVP